MDEFPSTVDPRLADKYLVFRIAEEVHGIRVLAVREIVRSMPITRVPNKPRYMRGLINLRGKVMPVLDLRDALGMGETEKTELSVILIVQYGDSHSLIGIFVDEVLEVADVGYQQLSQKPAYGANEMYDFILAVAQLGERLLFLLDIDRCLGKTAEMVSAGTGAAAGQLVVA
jgi:purine-binding chemotaxis protein CheW